MNRKKVAIVLLFIFLFSAILPNVNVSAKVNTTYYDIEAEGDAGEQDIGVSAIIIKWAAEILYTFSYGAELAGANIVKAFTGKAFFPWADKIIFNTIPILDVNFINPAPGSLMNDYNGNETFIGETIRKVYFTSLTIAIGFIGIIVAVMAIKLAISTIAAQKAKYKEAIVGWLTCIVLLFTLHFILSFMFYLNEKLVETASTIGSTVLKEASSNVVKNLKAEADKDNEKIVLAFVKKCKEKALIEKIPIVGKVVSWAKSIINAIGNALKAAWKWLTGDTNDKDEVSVDELNTMYPEKDDYVKWFENKDDPDHKIKMDVAAYLLKSKYYRKNYLEWIGGNDTNSITESGLEGAGRNILITCNDCLGIVDTGYKALRQLFTSVALIIHKGDGQPFKSVAQAAQEKIDSDEEKKKNLSDEARTDLENQKKAALLNSNGKNSYFYQIVTSTADYNAYITACDQLIEENNKIIRENSGDKKKAQNNVFGLTMSKIYASAYYEYCYQGNDKYQPKASDSISSLGDYFRESSWYVDTQRGDWSPTTINVVSALCYIIFIVQSLMFVFAYFKRFFYVIILSIIGPIVVVYDYFKKSMSL